MTRRAPAGPTPSSSCRSRYQASSSRGLSSTRRAASRSRTWAASRKRSPPYLTKGIRRRRSSTSSRSLWWAAAEQHRLLAQRHARLVVLEHDVGDRLGLGPLIGAGGEHRSGAAGLGGPQPLGVALGRAGEHGVGQVEDGLRRAVVAAPG